MVFRDVYHTLYLHVFPGVFGISAWTNSFHLGPTASIPFRPSPSSASPLSLSPPSPAKRADSDEPPQHPFPLRLPISLSGEPSPVTLLVFQRRFRAAVRAVPRHQSLPSTLPPRTIRAQLAYRLRCCPRSPPLASSSPCCWPRVPRRRPHHQHQGCH